MKKLLFPAGLLPLLLFIGWSLWGRRLQPGAYVSIVPAEAPDQLGRLASTVDAGSREIVENANRPIDFFGIVVDQEDKPIPDVRVTLEVRFTKQTGVNAIGDTFAYPVAMTGPDGRFQLSGAKGSILGIKNLEKQGYEPSKKSLWRSFVYWQDKDPYKADPNKPEVFTMWKKSGAERLIRKGISQAIRYDGTPTAFNLFTGMVTSEGDLRVSLIRTPPQITYGQKNFEWTATIEVPAGGVVVSTADQMYLAPEEGYERKVVIHVPANDPKWTSMKELGVFMKLRNGKYYGRAKLEFMVASDRETTPFSVTSWVNPSGGRNLEYDPSQNLAPVPTPVSPGTK